MRKGCWRGAGVLLASALLGAAQVAQKANEDYATAAMRQRAAFEMDHWVRPKVEDTRRLVSSLELRPGMTVADVGAGVGYLLSHLLAAVGPHGAIIAEDIHPDFLAKADDKIRAAGWPNVRTVLGTEYDAKLPQARVDVALVLDTYHHFNYPIEMLKSIRRALKPEGQLIIVEYYRSRRHPCTTMEDLREHIRLDRDEVAAEVSAQGFRLGKTFDHLPHEYVLMFDRKPAGGPRDRAR